MHFFIISIDYQIFICHFNSDKYVEGNSFIKSLFIGLPFAAFIETFFLLSQRKFPTARNLLDSVHHLINICMRHLNPTLQPLSSALNHQSSQHLYHLTRNNSIISSSSLNIRSNNVSNRSAIIRATVNRSVIAPTSAPFSRSHSHQNKPSKKTTDEEKKQNMLRQSTKSVFPLFF